MKDLRHTVLLVIGLLGLVKAVVGIMKPDWSRKLAQRWMRMIGSRTGKVVGVVCVLLAVALWVIVLLDQDLIDQLLVVFGFLFIWAGMMYFQPSDLKNLMNLAVMNRKDTALRIIFGVVGIVSGLLIWVALTQ